VTSDVKNGDELLRKNVNEVKFSVVSVADAFTVSERDDVRPINCSAWC